MSRDSPAGSRALRGTLAVLAFAAAWLLAPRAEAQSVAAPIGAGSFPHALAINPVTNRIYVVNEGDGVNPGSVTVIDGANGSTVTVPVGVTAGAIAVNPLTNRIYVVNADGDSVTVINGADNSTVTVPTGANPQAVAVNPVTNLVYVANSGGNSVTVINGANNSVAATVPAGAGTNPRSIAVNPVTNRIYVGNYFAQGVLIIDAAAGNATATVSVGQTPQALAVNPVTNRIYVVNADGGGVTVIHGADNSTAPVAVQTNPRAVAVNPVANRIYVTNYGSGSVTVIDGATDTVERTVTVGTGPSALAVNAASNRIYVANEVSGDVTVINGATGAASAPLVLSGGPSAIAVHPLTNRVYAPIRGNDAVGVIDGAETPAASAVAVPPAVAIGSLPANDTTASSVVFDLTASSGYAPAAPAVLAAYYRIDGGPWQAAGGAAPAFSAPSGALSLGAHLVEAFAIDAMAATTANTGFGASPVTGSVSSYAFTRSAVLAVTTTAVASDSNPSSFGSSVTFAATISGGTSPTGTVQFKDGGADIGAPVAVSAAQAQLSLNTLGTGSHSITAVYSGDAGNAGSTSPGLTQVVNAAGTSTVVASSANPSRQGQAVTFTATLSGGASPAGTVQFKDGAANLGAPVSVSGGQAQLTLSSLLPGSHSIGAAYGGNTNNGASNAVAITQVVQPTGRADFNGDGKADLFWLHATGQTYVWQMNGALITDSGSPASTGDSNWKVKGVGDFDGDGKADVLFRHKSKDAVPVGTGTTVVWLMNGKVIAGSGSPGTVADLGWEIQGVGDFDGDGKSDVLWMHTDGRVQVWLMNGTAAPVVLPVIALGASSGWAVQGVGDFNGDGKADILWKHASGTVVMWFMNGATISTSGTVASVGPDTATGWRVQGVGDFNGDGKADVLWRNDDIGGVIYVWLMNGTTITSAVNVTGVGTEAATGWIVKAIGDYNGDGKADVFWKNDLTLGGITYVWLMNGTTITTATSITGVPDLNWQVINPK